MFRKFILPSIITFCLSICLIEGTCQNGDSQAELEQQLAEAVKNRTYDKAAFYTFELAKVQLDNGQPEQAKDYLAQSLSHAKKASDNLLLYLASERLGQILFYERSFSKSLDNFERSLKYAEDLKNNEFIGNANLYIANCHIQLNKPKRAISPLEIALSQARQQGDEELELECYELLSITYTKLSNIRKANEYQSLTNNILQSRLRAEQNTQKREELEAKIAETDADKKQTTSKLQKQTRKLLQVEDSLLSTRYSLNETASTLREIEAIKEKQQMDIDLLNKDKELSDMRLREQDADLKNQVLIRNSVIGGIVLTSVIVIVLIIGYRRSINANKKIDQQNASIKSSINYAKRIQEAMLHKADQYLASIPDSFILFKPRDAVSGDFYWFSEIKYSPDITFAAVDCTGHGVPGAFMSMIGINALNGIISRGITESNQILDALDLDVKTALQQEKSGNNDGMDIALCIYRKEKNLIEYAGAKNPLVYIQDGALNVIKGDGKSIGGNQNNHSFKKHLVVVDKSTMVYVFSDGYRDQFGGEDNSKFMSKRFHQLLLDIHNEPMDKQKEILDREIEAWKGSRIQTDDILVMGLRIEPGNIS